MDIEASAVTVQRQEEPEIRCVSDLKDIRKVIPAKPPVSIIAPQKKQSIAKGQRSIIVPVVIGVFFLFLIGIISYQLSAMQRRNKLNYELYQLALSHKNKAEILDSKLQYANKIKNILRYNQKTLRKSFSFLSSKYNALQSKMEKDRIGYENLLAEKTSIINGLQNDMRLVSAREEAVRAQNEVLSKTMEEKDSYVRELTDKLVYNITQQELLISENLRFKKQFGELPQEEPLSEPVGAVETENVNK